MYNSNTKFSNRMLIEHGGEENQFRQCIYIYIYIYCAGSKIDKNEMGEACGAYGAGERDVQGSGGET